MMKKSVRPEWEQRWMRLAAPHRPVDLEIALAFGKASEDYKIAKGSVTGFICGDGVGGYGNPTVANYSGDVNAMLALLDEQAPEYNWTVQKTLWVPGDPYFKYAASLHRNYGGFLHGLAHLPAIALAIALRKVLEARVKVAA